MNLISGGSIDNGFCLLKLQGLLVQNIHLLAGYHHWICPRGLSPEISSYLFNLGDVQLQQSIATPLHEIMEGGAVLLLRSREEWEQDCVVSRFDVVMVGMDALSVISTENEQEGA